MAANTGPASLPTFEDRVLYYLVELAGDRPLPVGTGITESTIAEYLAEDLGLSADTLSEAITSGRFHHIHERGTILASIQELMHEGLADGEKSAGPWIIRPTLAGRRRVAKWCEEWARRKQDLERKVRQRILEDLDRQRRADPNSHASTGYLNVAALCAALDITQDDYRRVAESLLDQGKVSLREGDEHMLDEGFISITDLGVETVEATAAATRPRRDAQEAWVEVARLQRQLEIAQRTPSSFINDEELRQRCEDLLAAGAHYDRVVREACVILENRVRGAIGATRDVIGTTLMERAFGAASGPLRLSTLAPEQAGAMQLYRGVMAFFRNDAGHHLIDTYSQDDALRLVAFVDLLLAMVERARPI